MTPIHRLLQPLLTLLILLLCTGRVYAINSPLSDYFVESWTSSDGLPHNSINAITQTEDGYLWFATWEGVARYNGLDFKLYNRGPVSHMQDSGTKALTARPGNRLFVAGARGSLTERRGFDWHPHSSANNLINHVFEDDRKNLWLAVEGKGVILRQHRPDGSYLPDRWVLNISSYRLIQRGESLYAATAEGLFRLSRAGTPAEKIETPLFQRVFYISQDQQQRLLLATNKGAWRWDGRQFTALGTDLQDLTITLIEQDRTGNLWLGTINRGIARLQGDQAEFLDDSQGLPNNRVWSWYQDLEGSIWVGTNGGVIRLRRAPFVTVTERQGLIGNYVRTLLPLDEEQVLAGTSNGLSLLKGNRPEPATRGKADALSVLSLAHRQAGGVWVGTYQKGLYHWQSGALTPAWNEDSGLASNEIRAILEDHQGNLWLGTPNGLIRRTPSGEVHHYRKENSPLPGNFVMALTEDEAGRIWIGTGVGVAFLKADQWQPVALPEKESAQYAFGFYSEPGAVWMATDRGIARYRQADASVSIIGRSNGLPNDKFFQILADDSGHFWLSSNRGIWRIRQQEAREVVDGTRETLGFEHFGESDGMAISQANGGSNPAAVRTDNGRLLFATAKGVAGLKPAHLEQARNYRIPTVLESVRFDNRVINPQAQQTVPAAVNRLQFDYVGLSYVMSDRLQYRTRLQGFDTGWAYRGESNRAEYTNLPPGEYEFQVSVRYPYGTWHDAGTLYRFEVQPSFWQRLEVRLISLLLLLGLAVGLVQWRMQLLKRSARRLEQKVADQTSELRQQARKFERLSREDTLTGLANRRAFDQTLAERFARCRQKQQPLVVAIIDIDHFKRVNDDYSHLIGDRAIQAVADTLKQHFTTDNIARWGGEEFTALYSPELTGSDTLAGAAYRHFDQLRRSLAETPFDHLAPGLRLTISIGFAISEHTEDYDQLLKAADHALLNAKQNGRNRVIQADQGAVGPVPQR